VIRAGPRRPPPASCRHPSISTDMTPVAASPDAAPAASTATGREQCCAIPQRYLPGCYASPRENRASRLGRRSRSRPRRYLHRQRDVTGKHAPSPSGTRPGFPHRPGLHFPWSLVPDGSFCWSAAAPRPGGVIRCKGIPVDGLGAPRASGRDGSRSHRTPAVARPTRWGTPTFTRTPGEKCATGGPTGAGSPASRNSASTEQSGRVPWSGVDPLAGGSAGEIMPSSVPVWLPSGRRAGW
jgi:hypothetical protein